MQELSKPRLFTAAQLVSEQRRGALILDTRSPEQFASAHIPGALQISLLGSFASWAALLIHPTQRLILIADDPRGAQEAWVRLTRVGFGQVIGYALADEAQLREAGLQLVSLSVQRCESIRADLQSGGSPQLVDVRSRAEWLKGHLPGAISVPLLGIDQGARQVDPSRRSLVYCHEGYRAATAASILERSSPGNIGILIDGVEGWVASGLPLEVPKDTVS